MNKDEKLAREAGIQLSIKVVTTLLKDLMMIVLFYASE